MSKYEWALVLLALVLLLVSLVALMRYQKLKAEREYRQIMKNLSQLEAKIAKAKSLGDEIATVQRQSKKAPAVHEGRVDRTQQPRAQTSAPTNQVYDPSHPLNPISPVSPFNTVSSALSDSCPGSSSSGYSSSSDSGGGSCD